MKKTPEPKPKNETDVPPQEPLGVSQEKTGLLSSSKKNDAKKKLLIGILIGIFISTLVAGSAYLFIKSKAEKKKDFAYPPTPTTGPTTSPPVEIKKSGEVNWLNQPQKIQAPNIFAPLEADMPYDTRQAVFYKVAEFSDSSILINSYIPIGGPASTVMFRLLKTQEDKYFCLENFLDEWSAGEIKKQFLPEVELVKMEIQELTPPESFTADNMKLAKGFYEGNFFRDLAGPQKVVSSSYGDVYKTYQNILDSNEIFARKLYLKLKDHTVAPYILKTDILSDEGVAQVTWLNGQKNEAQFTQGVISTCGPGLMGTVPIIKDGSILINEKQVSGKTDQSHNIYQVKGADNELIKALYGLYKVGRDFSDAPAILSIEEFSQKETHFLWQDQLGDWQIFVDNEYASLAECGKPVIYLYPEKTSLVKVAVDASITKSEPLYPEGGWLVTAYPDGHLIYQNQNYESLFWEGLGNGFYPDYKDRGFLVTQEKLLPTIKNHLSLLGLNKKERDDFLEFWTPKLPQTPYVRLTWLGTREMDILAPLFVEPQPQTRIRVFLEFEGLNKPKRLTPQKLTAVERKGFTLIEWGGLLLTP